MGILKNNVQKMFASAVLDGDEDGLAQALSLGANPCCKKGLGYAPVLEAVKWGHAGCLDILAKAGADMQVKSDLGLGVAIMAIIYKKEACLRVAIQHGVDVNAIDQDGECASFMAARCGNEGCLRILIKAGADVVGTKNNAGRDALMAAAQHGDLGCVELLLQVGADVQARDNFGETALDLAIAEGHREVAGLLRSRIEAGQMDTFLASPVVVVEGKAIRL